MVAAVRDVRPRVDGHEKKSFFRAKGTNLGSTPTPSKERKSLLRAPQSKELLFKITVSPMN
jgi:hypothetical protein